MYLVELSILWWGNRYPKKWSELTWWFKGRVKGSSLSIAHCCFPSPKSPPTHYTQKKVGEPLHRLTYHLTLPWGLRQPHEVLKLSTSSSRVGEGKSPLGKKVPPDMWALDILQCPPISWGLQFRWDISHSFLVSTMCQVSRQRSTTSCCCSIILWVYKVDNIVLDFSFRDVLTPQGCGNNWNWCLATGKSEKGKYPFISLFL